MLIGEELMRLINRGFDEDVSNNQNLTFDYLNTALDNLGYKLDDEKKKDLGFVDSNDKFTNLALLLSDQNMHSIRIAIFQGTDKRIFKEDLEVTGSILKQLDEALRYLDKVNSLMARFYPGQAQREDTYDYDKESLREGILNALIHRNYSSPASIMINSYIDRIEIVSIGGLASGISKDAIMSGISLSRNRMLLRCLHEIGYLRAYGDGIDKIYASYKGFNVRPKIEALNDVFVLTLPNRNYDDSLVPDYMKAPIYLNDKGIRLDTQKERIMDELWDKEYLTKEDVSTLLGVKTNRAYKILEEMLEMNLVSSNRLGKKKIYMKK